MEHRAASFDYNAWRNKGDLDPECCIYRVPKVIRKVNEKAYTPQVISIGPFHYDEKEFIDMEKQKRRYVCEFFKRTTSEKFEQVYAFIKDREEQIRNYYSETCNLQSCEYVEMVLHDAIFIIELLLKNFEDKSDILLAIPVEIIALKLDLQLLENQLPYFLLEGLYKLVVSSPPFIDLCFDFFKDQMFDSVYDKEEIKHFTDLRRSALVKSYGDQVFCDYEYSEINLPCATKLHDSGVKFKAVHERNQCLLDIKFEAEEFRIPHLKVYDETETILRNIMALEQCYYRYETLVCAYVEILDSLIDTKSDVDLLVKEGIIFNRLGKKKELESLFNELCSHMPINKRFYYKIQRALKAHYDVPWNHEKATLKSVYFKDRWRGTATVAATAGLLFTFISAVTSIWQLIVQ